MVFAAWQQRTAHPLLPPGVLLDRDRAAGYSGILLASVGMFGVLLFVNYYLQNSLHYSPIRTGLAFVPMVVLLVIGSQPATNVLLPRLGHRRVVPTGMALGAVGMVLLTGLGPDSTYATGVLPALLLIGFGIGNVITSSFQAGGAPAPTPREHSSPPCSTAANSDRPHGPVPDSTRFCTGSPARWTPATGTCSPPASFPRPWATSPPAEPSEGDSLLLDYKAFLPPLDTTQHLVTNVETVINGDTAEATACFLAQHVRANTEGGDQFLIGGRYDDRLTRTPEGWRTTRRRVNGLWTQGIPKVVGSTLDRRENG
ncbi:MFS transporter [Streptomyces rapamycinicus]|uniref:SnoaL-like domain-containing protein n=2 Tax=Streptomyces rapamycinicus TaxID=1226757 RepID=A0A0A0N6Y5_STRRN|nr:MFS transporter [Streptomyces rapamycinicus]AGP52269.1 hypothetical protein M271_03190 [Streptomyces rapamycinicus NRRL 5491]MBB4779729.1 hypothetical protein [Streptomyces rapamycinicus]RLV75611.1 hypothetical protein D3C57_140335 [Streptomyces rapamycinicus NRRL 5491]